MKKRISAKLLELARKQIRQELASAGGKARAKKYSKATLSRWAKKGGRPKKSRRLRKKAK